jgi:uncharacterized protein
MNPDNKPGRFHWLDLAAVDATSAMKFYEGMFGWQARRHRVNGGEIYRFTHEGKDVASLYQLRSRQIDGGVPSHWTPYVAVASVDEFASRAETLGGRVVVKPFDVPGMARVSLLDDAAGGLFGLWELPQ